MNNNREKLIQLTKNIISLGDELIKKDRIIFYSNSLEIITHLEKQENLTKDETIALRKLTEELIKRGINEPVVDQSYKNKKIFELTDQAKEILKTIPSLKEEIKIENINDWIKSLKIFKLKGKYLSEDYYDNSYDLYLDMRKIILTRSTPMYKRVYLNRVADKLDSEENKKKLPKGIKLEFEDYELNQIIKMIKNDPDFNYHLTRFFRYFTLEANERFEREEWKKNLLLLTKNEKSV